MFHLNYLTYLLWAYASRNDPAGVLKKVDEPLEGNPPQIMRGRKLISQDLANSALEFMNVSAPVEAVAVDGFVTVSRVLAVPVIPTLPRSASERMRSRAQR